MKPHIFSLVAHEEREKPQTAQYERATADTGRRVEAKQFCAEARFPLTLYVSCHFSSFSFMFLGSSLKNEKYLNLLIFI